MREKIPQPNQRARLYYRGRFGERGKDYFNWMVTVTKAYVLTIRITSLTIRPRKIPRQLKGNVQNIENAIEAYAMATGSISTRKYAKQYKRSNWIKHESSPDEVSEVLLSELEAEFAKIKIPTWNGSPVND